MLSYFYRKPLCRGDWLAVVGVRRTFLQHNFVLFYVYPFLIVPRKPKALIGVYGFSAAFRAYFVLAL